MNDTQTKDRETLPLSLLHNNANSLYASQVAQTHTHTHTHTERERDKERVRDSLLP